MSLSIRRAQLVSTITLTLILLVGLLSLFFLSPLLATRKPTHTISLHLPEPKSYPKPINKPTLKWHRYTIQKNDNLSDIFRKHHLTQSTLITILKLGKAIKPLKQLHPGRLLKWQTNPDGKLTQLAYQPTVSQQLTITYTKSGYRAKRRYFNLEPHIHYSRGIIHRSFYVAARRAGLSPNQITKLANIFAWDVDFIKDIRPGDRFTVIYNDYYNNDKRIKAGDIIAARITLKNRTITALRFKNPKGIVSYFDEKGRSLQKAFLRSPVKYTRISSSFSLRRFHPIKHLFRRHTGTDFAARRGVPVRATASGRVIFSGRSGGYGKLIKIRHSKKYVTYYAHLSRFAKKTKPKRWVKQGDIIGYVGQTGLATAPHVHYEIRINKKPRNAMTVKLPRARRIRKAFRSRFFIKAKSLLAQLNLYEQAMTASN